MKHLAYWLMAGSCALLLSACGSGSDSNGEGRLDTDYSELRFADPALGPLSNQHPPRDFSEYLRNGLRLSVRPMDYPDGNGEPVADSPPMAGDGAEGAGDDFSRTNVHVEGVDEADRLKYDGEHLFVAESPYYTYDRFLAVAEIDSAEGGDGSSQDPPKQAVRIYSTEPEAVGATWLTRFEFDRDESDPITLSQLYTLDDEQGRAEAVAALSDTKLFYHFGWDARPAYGFNTGATRIDLIDVQSPLNPQLSWSLELEGGLVNSRKIGDVLYLVTRTVPSIEGVEPFPSTQEQIEQNERLIRDTPIAELLPEYTVDDSASAPLVQEQDCFLPREISPNEGYADLLTISAINLRSRELVSSACVNAQLSGLYMSLDSLYLATVGGSGTEQKTGLHKFAVEAGDISYRGTGVVPGRLNRTDPSFSLDEQDDYLRVVSTLNRSFNDFEHTLHVLREPESGDTESLEIVARLPNEEQPAVIGKPGEDIFAVRFLGERAYIVTFERIDPLYVLDLSDNENPRIAGELEIPGFSTYLHPVGEGYLVSVGEAANEFGMPQGIKIELFDVRDDANPKSLATEVIGGTGSWSEALYDLRAFNFLQVGDDQLRFTVPVTRREDYNWVDSGLHLFEVNNLSGEQATLAPAGSLIVESRESSGDFGPGNSGNDRSRLHGDTVYYLHGNDIWASDWSDPENLQGPFTQ